MSNFNKLRNLLKKQFPQYKVSVRRVKLKKAYGTWQVIDRKKKMFLIKIDKSATEGEQIDSLCHEWSHICQADNTFEGLNQHHSAWGITYAKLYRLYEENILKNHDE